MTVTQAKYLNSDNTDVAATINGLLWAIKPDDERLQGITVDAYVAPEQTRSPVITSYEYQLRFTAAERAAMLVAASQALSRDDASLQDCINLTNSAQVIDLSNPLVAEQMQLFVAAGCLTSERVQEILEP